VSLVSQSSSHASGQEPGGASSGDHLQDIKEEGGELTSLLVNNTSWLRNLNI